MAHISRRRFGGLVASLTAATSLGLTAFRIHEPIKVLILTGQNNHSWRRTTPLVEDILKETGLFKVELSIAPPPDADAEIWSIWRPNFSQYDVVLNNYSGDPWPEVVQQQFLAYVRGGGNCLVLHAANNAFEGWEPYESMVGLLWRDSTYGERIYLNDAGETVRVPAGEGPNAGHGEVHDWPITIRDAQHPITQGMPTVWMHAHDELYHSQRGPAQDMNLLATAYSSQESGGTGQHEPTVWWVAYGRGKVLTCLPGHLWPTQEEETAYQCVGFRTLLARCTEWLATGQVTIPIPDDFPTAEQTSVKNQ